MKSRQIDPFKFDDILNQNGEDEVFAIDGDVEDKSDDDSDLMEGLALNDRFQQEPKKYFHQKVKKAKINSSQ